MYVWERSKRITYIMYKLYSGVFGILVSWASPGEDGWTRSLNVCFLIEWTEITLRFSLNAIPYYSLFDITLLKVFISHETLL